MTYDFWAVLEEKSCKRRMGLVLPRIFLPGKLAYPGATAKASRLGSGLPRTQLHLTGSGDGRSSPRLAIVAEVAGVNEFRRTGKKTKEESGFVYFWKAFAEAT